MSVAFESNSSGDSNRIQSPHGMWIYHMSESTRFTGGNSNPWSSRLPVVKEEEDSTSSSSIGNNSDASGGEGVGDFDEDDGEVRSKDNGPLNGLNDLESVLPIKRGISAFYAGKSKSYGSLADAVSVPSIQEIVKPEDAYSRKRKNMLAHHVLLDKHRESSVISKRLASSSRSNFTLGININSHKSGGESSNTSTSMADLTRLSLPLNSNRKLSTKESPTSSPRLYSSPWRSLSLSDLQQASSITGLVSKKRDAGDEH